MKHLFASAAAIALLAACGGGEEKAAGGTSSSGGETTVAGVKLPTLELRAGDASEVADALAAMSLSESSIGRVAFDSVDIAGAKATFAGLTITPHHEADKDAIKAGEEPSEPSPLQAETLVFEGLEMTDEGIATFSRMTLSGVTGNTEDGEGVLSLGDIQLTNPSPEVAGFVASLFGAGEPAEFPTGDALAFEGFTLSNFNVDIDDGEEVGNVTLGGIELLGMANSKLQRMSVDSIDINIAEDEDSAPVVVKLGDMTVDGADLSFVEAMQAAGDDEDAAAAALLETLYADPADPKYDAMSISDFSVAADGVNFDIPSMKANVTRNNAGKAVRAVTAPFTMTLKADPEAGEAGAQLAGPLGMMGYEELVLSGAGDISMDPDADTVTYEPGKNYIALADGIRIDYAGKIGGLSEFMKAVAAAESDENISEEEALGSALEKMTFHSFELKLDDDSIVDRAFNLAAAMQGEDPENLRAQAQLLPLMLPAAAGQFGVDPEIATELAGALGTFLSTPGTLTLKFDPETPLAAASFEDPSALTKSALGFSAEATAE